MHASPRSPRLLAAAVLAALAMTACHTQRKTDAPATPPPAGERHASVDAEASAHVREARPERLALSGARVGHVSAAPSPQAPPAALGRAWHSQEVDRDTYAPIPSNPVQRVAEQPVSTFAVDVDTGSYTNVRRMLVNGQRPPVDAVRVEEMINFFRYDYPRPAGFEQPFTVTTALAPAPWNERRVLMQVGLQGVVVDKADLPPANLVFLVDTSGSMYPADRLPMLQRAFRMLVNELRPQDSVSIVVYAGSAGLVLPPTPGDRKGEIIAALERLAAGGSTNGGAGIQLAYAMARQGFVPDGINRVILATDGDFNVGTVSRTALETLVADQRSSGISLTTLGVGRGNYNDAMAERLANIGNGNHFYLDSLGEARRVLVQQMGATLHTIASDVKVQVEFNPAVVAEYRLVGYENRALRREEFDNDRVDAGEIGAGHSVTALYELALVGSGGEASRPLRYADAVPARAAALSDEVAVLRLRYKRPGEDASRLIEAPITRDRIQAEAGEDLRFAAAVAGFADLLRGGAHVGDFGWDGVAALARGARGEDTDGYRAEFLGLVELARDLTSGGQKVAVAD